MEISQELLELFRLAKEKNASDLYISTGSKPLLRINGELITIDGKEEINRIKSENYIKSFLPKLFLKKLELESDIDLSLEIENQFRFRVNIFIHSKGLTAIFHLIPLEVPSFQNLNLPTNLKKILDLKSGLVVFCGPSGCGKSTTQAAIINEINKSKAVHIITLEDPIEFRFHNIKSLIHQREIDIHTRDFYKALRAALREDPNIISIGEMRDDETIKTALKLAETGHLVFATLHANSASKAINRILDNFENHNSKEQIRNQLSDLLQMIIYQELYFDTTKNQRLPVCEILINNHQIKNLIRQNKIHQIDGIIEISTTEGMQTFDQAMKKITPHFH